MHLYLRLLKSSSAESYSVQEEQSLRKVLAEAPGVERVKLVERHIKGGYAVTLDVVKESLDQLIEYLPAHDLRSVF